MTYRHDDATGNADRPALEIENRELREILAQLIANFEDMEEVAALAGRRARERLSAIT